MKPRLLLFTAACMLFAACGNSRGDLSTGIIPAPQQVAWGDGAFRMPSTLLFATNLEGEDKADLAAWMRPAGLSLYLTRWTCLFLFSIGIYARRPPPPLFCAMFIE